MLELIAGVLVAGAAVALVLEPLWRRPGSILRPVEEPEFVDPEDSESPKIKALLALRELEFDQATGKLSDEDYERGKRRYARAAVEAIKAERSVEEGSQADPAERAIAAAGAHAAVCPACGPRPEDDAVFCSSCGRSLVQAGGRPRCAECGSELPHQATFCATCGRRVAA
ncbi:MAG TPA: zinc ribbon domain-containing protein [Gemmatimonadales bacterium]|jgi:hypothetical protein